MDRLAARRSKLYSRLSGPYEAMTPDDIDYLRWIIRQHPLTRMAIRAGYPEAVVVQAMEHLFRLDGARLRMVEEDDKLLVSIVPTRLH